MNQEEVSKHVTGLALKADLPRFGLPELACVLRVELERNGENLPESTVNALFLVAACLMRDYCDDVEADILATRAVYRRT